MSSDQIPIGSPVKDNEKIYYDLLCQYEKAQVETLDESGKRLIDRASAVLGLLFTIAAIGKDSLPAYLSEMKNIVPLLIILLVSTNLSLLSGFFLLMPRKYKFFAYNLTENEKEFKKLLGRKSFLSILGSIFFFIAMIVLSIIIVTILLGLNLQ